MIVLLVDSTPLLSLFLSISLSIFLSFSLALFLSFSHPLHPRSLAIDWLESLRARVVVTPLKRKWSKSRWGLEIGMWTILLERRGVMKILRASLNYWFSKHLPSHPPITIIKIIKNHSSSSELSTAYQSPSPKATLRDWEMFFLQRRYCAEFWWFVLPYQIRWLKGCFRIREISGGTQGSSKVESGNEGPKISDGSIYLLQVGCGHFARSTLVQPPQPPRGRGKRGWGPASSLYTLLYIPTMPSSTGKSPCSKPKL